MPALRVTPDIDTAAAAPRDGADEPRAGGDTKEDSQNETNESMAKELARSEVSSPWSSTRFSDSVAHLAIE